MTDPKSTTELEQHELDQVQGGIALLLPAVQKVREAAARGSDGTGDGTPDLITGSSAGGGLHARAFGSNGEKQ